MGALVVLACAVAAPFIKKRLNLESPGVTQQIIEMFIETVYDLLRRTVGRGGERFLPLLGTFFFFIFFCNFVGQIPGLEPPTGLSPGITFGLSIFAFAYYQSQAFVAVGPSSYFGHFIGPAPIKGLPVWMSVPMNIFLIAIFLVVETISHFARILTLSIRLFANIFAEHTAMGAVLGLVPFGLPLMLLGLGVFASVLQAFIFVFLTMIYLGLFVSHEQH